MAYLQVRDFPEALHEQLKDLAKREHRSVSQQVIIAIEAHVSEAAARAREVVPFNDETLEQRTASRQLGSRQSKPDHAQRRREVLARIQTTPRIKIPEGFPGAAELIHGARAERDTGSGGMPQMIHEAREDCDARIVL